MSAYYLLASADLARDTQGRIVRVAEGNRIYLGGAGPHAGHQPERHAAVPGDGLPGGTAATTVQQKTADWLLVLVLLPFWTSLLVRTAAWVVVLQKEGMVNSLLLKLG